MTHSRLEEIKKREEYYKILEIEPKEGDFAYVNTKIIKKQYNKLALQLHPDKAAAKEDSFIRVTDAYKALLEYHAKIEAVQSLFVFLEENILQDDPEQKEKIKNIFNDDYFIQILGSILVNNLFSNDDFLRLLPQSYLKDKECWSRFKEVKTEFISRPELLKFLRKPLAAGALQQGLMNYLKIESGGNFPLADQLIETYPNVFSQLSMLASKGWLCVRSRGGIYNFSKLDRFKDWWDKPVFWKLLADDKYIFSIERAANEEEFYTRLQTTLTALQQHELFKESLKKYLTEGPAPLLTAKQYIFVEEKLREPKIVTALMNLARRNLLGKIENDGSYQFTAYKDIAARLLQEEFWQLIKNKNFAEDPQQAPDHFIEHINKAFERYARENVDSPEHAFTPQQKLYLCLFGGYCHFLPKKRGKTVFQPKVVFFDCKASALIAENVSFSLVNTYALYPENGRWYLNYYSLTGKKAVKIGKIPELYKLLKPYKDINDIANKDEIKILIKKYHLQKNPLNEELRKKWESFKYEMMQREISHFLSLPELYQTGWADESQHLVNIVKDFFPSKHHNYNIGRYMLHLQESLIQPLLNTKQLQTGISARQYEIAIELMMRAIFSAIAKSIEEDRAARKSDPISSCAAYLYITVLKHLNVFIRTSEFLIDGQWQPNLIRATLMSCEIKAPEALGYELHAPELMKACNNEQKKLKQTIKQMQSRYNRHQFSMISSVTGPSTVIGSIIGMVFAPFTLGISLAIGAAAGFVVGLIMGYITGRLTYKDATQKLDLTLKSKTTESEENRALVLFEKNPTVNDLTFTLNLPEEKPLPEKTPNAGSQSQFDPDQPHLQDQTRVHPYNPGALVEHPSAEKSPTPRSGKK